ncbi:hypothetical protein UCRPA7_7710 [Phaeoacremonium minimum UCRPA7]|uniref:Uncharacterized protein n=1 Tax=Phaeoacremonium minimum (strain UCR-PA7) TaxID=1286976 RepID=R8BBY8_PHAM7|nr:hypothetical protein UCRPA7_7710 [Phaeoacremonium minimum UCRPA7]EON96816.1 hypothetical protein UCRPA7_7710 [Phaeoacremonium minimum UCRPA7]
MDHPSHRVTSDDLHAGYLDRSVRELEDKVRQHELALSKLRETPIRQYGGPVESTIASMEIMTKAYEDVTTSDPFLPFPDSVLPALIALRNTHRTIAESREYLASQATSLKKANQRLEVEQANLNDQKALQKSLEARIQSLRDGLESRMEMTPKEITKEKINELKQKKRGYDKDTSKLLKALNKFIDDHLGVMLAAEELGGPVVGDMMDVDADDLNAGFSAHGKLKKVKQNQNQDKRQRRIDDIWGAEQRQNSKAKEEWNEAVAAGQEMRELTEELLNALTDSGGDGSAAYVIIPRETAASRFLVRAKVAQFHPRDATRLRLIDFGREIDD